MSETTIDPNELVDTEIEGSHKSNSLKDQEPNDKTDLSKSTIVVVSGDGPKDVSFSDNETVQVNLEKSDLKIDETAHQDFVVVDIQNKEGNEISLEDLIDSQIASISEFTSDIGKKSGTRPGAKKKNKRKKKKSPSSSPSPAPETAPVASEADKQVESNLKDELLSTEITATSQVKDDKITHEKANTAEKTEIITEKGPESEHISLVKNPGGIEISEETEDEKLVDQVDKTLDIPQPQNDLVEPTIKTNDQHSLPIETRDYETKENTPPNESTENDDPIALGNNTKVAAKDAVNESTSKEEPKEPIKTLGDDAQKEAVEDIQHEDYAKLTNDVLVSDNKETISSEHEATDVESLEKNGIENKTFGSESLDQTKDEILKGSQFEETAETLEKQEPANEVADDSTLEEQKKEDLSGDKITYVSTNTATGDSLIPEETTKGDENEDLKSNTDTGTIDSIDHTQEEVSNEKKREDNKNLEGEGTFSKETEHQDEKSLGETTPVPSEGHVDSIKGSEISEQSDSPTKPEVQSNTEPTVVDETERLIKELEAEIGNSLSISETKSPKVDDIPLNDTKEEPQDKAVNEEGQNELICDKPEQVITEPVSEEVLEENLDSEQPLDETSNETTNETTNDAVSSGQPSEEIIEEEEEELREPTKEEIIEYLKDEPVYIYTSLAGGGFHMPQRTNSLVTILTANRVPFTYRDLGTDEEARNVWRRYSKGRLLPGVVRGKDDIIGNWEEIQEANEDYRVRELIYETL